MEPARSDIDGEASDGQEDEEEEEKPIENEEHHEHSDLHAFLSVVQGVLDGHHRIDVRLLRVAVGEHLGMRSLTVLFGVLQPVRFVFAVL